MRSSPSEIESVPSSSSCVHTDSTASSMSVIFAPTKGSDHVKASMKLGSQYGCEVALNCLETRQWTGHRVAAEGVPDGQRFVLIFDDCAFIMVYIQVVWCAEYCDERGKPFLWGLGVHEVPGECG